MINSSGLRRGCSGDQFAIDFGSDEFGEVDLGLAFAHWWFEIQQVERIEDDQGQERGQEKAFDGNGVVLEDVIGLPWRQQQVRLLR